MASTSQTVVDAVRHVLSTAAGLKTLAPDHPITRESLAIGEGLIYPLSELKRLDDALVSLAAALPALDAMAADRERLDWLEKQGLSTQGERGVHSWPSDSPIEGWTARYVRSDFKSLRDAIDAARAQEPR